MTDPIKEKIETSRISGISTGEDTSYYQKLIVENLKFIEKQCYKACAIYKRNIPPPIDLDKDSKETKTHSLQVVSPDEVDQGSLVNDVIDRLRADNYKVLQDFKGHSKLTTYIGTIISNSVVDLIRKQKGRNRAKDRAMAMGLIGEKLYELVLEKGFPVEEAYEYLKEKHHITETFEEIEITLERIRGRKTGLIPVDSIEKPELATGDDPENELTKKQGNELAKNALNQILSELSNEEKFIIRMRFPLSEDEEPKGIPEIARILGLTEKAVDGRIRRILAKCKEMVLRNGLSITDLIET